MKLIKASKVCEMLGISRTTLWRTVKRDPSFPRKRYISANRVGFIEAEVCEWLENATKPKIATYVGD